MIINSFNVIHHVCKVCCIETKKYPFQKKEPFFEPKLLCSLFTNPILPPPPPRPGFVCLFLIMKFKF